MKNKLVILAILACVVFRVLAFRAPSVPIVSSDPFFSIWSGADVPTEVDTEIWHGAKQPISVVIELDGVSYRLLGAKKKAGPYERGTDIPALKCTGTEVRPLTTVYRFTDGRAKVELSFMTPKLADDLSVFARPVTYATIRTSGASNVCVHASISPALATHDDRAAMATNFFQVAGLPAYAIGRVEQKLFSKSGDKLRCNWGRAAIVNPDMKGSDVHFLLGYDGIAAVRFLGKNLRFWWQRGGKSFEAMLADAEHDYSSLIVRARDFDSAFARSMRLVGGEKYAQLASLAYRQSYAACVLAEGPEGQPFLMSNENTSGGYIATTDVFYPQLPLLLLTSRALVKATLEPMMVYAASPAWGRRFAPHDIGRFPIADGQQYRMDRTRYPNDTHLMPVEECGNMLLCLGALSTEDANADFAGRWWKMVTGWAEYLDEVGVDPGDQLCTDDFAGHLDKNANLSIKTVLALAAYARMAKMRGDSKQSDKYRQRAEAMAVEWQRLAKDGADGGYRLAFDRPDSWSLKYNLIWDRVLDFNMFPSKVSEKEMAVYRNRALPFGIALDCRNKYAKTDWEFWVAALTGKRGDLEFVTDLVWRFANETPDRVPLADWYWANSARAHVMYARSVIGGMFMAAYDAKRHPLKESVCCPAVDGQVHASTLLELKTPGDVLVAWFQGVAEGTDDVAIVGTRRVSGKWEPSRRLAKVSSVAHWNPVLRRGDDGRIVLMFKVGSKIASWKTYYVESRDEGLSWNDPRELVLGDSRGGRGPVKNKCLKLKNGRILAPASREVDAWRSFVDISDDDGRTWRESAEMPVHDVPGVKNFGVIQPSLWQSEDGCVHALLRSNGGLVYRSDSEDNGETWSEVYATSLPNNNSGIDLVRTDDGNIYLAMNAAAGNWASRSRLDVRVSHDDGASWELVKTLVDDAPADVVWGKSEYSYPAIVVLSTGKIAVTYTWNRKYIVLTEMDPP